MVSILKVKSRPLVLTIYLFAILIVIYLPVNLYLLIAIFIGTLFVCTSIDKEFFIYAPFVIYPFSYLLRAGDGQNIIVALLPDLISFLYFGIYIFYSKLYLHASRLILSLLFFSILVTLLHIANTTNLIFIIIILREYFFPVIFLIVTINFYRLYPSSMKSIFNYCIISYAFVCGIVFLNLFGILIVNPSTPFLYPYVRYEYFLETGDFKQLNSRVIFGFPLPRLNTYLGGALGSSGAILMAFGLISLYRASITRSLYYILLAFLFICISLATLSTSILIPFLIFYFVFFLKNRINLLLLPLVSVLLYILLSTSIYNFGSPYEYFVNSSLNELLEGLNNMSFFNVIFGYGPYLASDFAKFQPKEVLIDVGFFKVLFESGLPIFLLYILPVIYVIYNCFYRYIFKNFSINKEILFFSLVMLFMFHGNVAMNIPFYPLFSILIANLYSMDLKKYFDQLDT